MYKETLEQKKAIIALEKANAIEYVDEFKRNNKYISIRIRDGFIGKELSDDGRVLQAYRGKPRGTMVAFKNPNKENEILIGISYLKKADKDIPIIGIANAIKYAKEETKKYVAYTESKDKNEISVCRIMNNKIYTSSWSKNDRELYEYFKIRALCYFYPEYYSYSRGTDKIEYPNYEKNQKNRKRVLGE